MNFRRFDDLNENIVTFSRILSTVINGLNKIRRVTCLRLNKMASQHEI